MFSSSDIKQEAEKRALDRADQEIIGKAIEDGIETAWERFALQQPQCGFGQLGVCCNNCAMGPCRIDPYGGKPSHGVCGANVDTIVSRNLLDDLSVGAAAHSDHGREVVEVLLETAEGKAEGYRIYDEEKLKRVAEEYGIGTAGRSKEDIAKDLALGMLAEFGSVKGFIQMAERAPDKTKAIWTEFGITPRGIDREIVEAMHRVHMGVDADFVNILLHAMRTALADGWGGSMIATDCSDILFGTPKPLTSWANLGTLSTDKVNVVLHGHNPLLSEMIVQAAEDPDLKKYAIEKGAKGINLVGMCCTGNELLMRSGIPIAGNILDQELAIATGAVEAMVVDYQCIFPSIPATAGCYHTKVVTTSRKAKIPGTQYMEFSAETALSTAKEIIRLAIDNYPNRNPDRVRIPGKPMKVMAGFSEEEIRKALGGTYKPLIDAIVAGQIKGVVGIVGCNHPRIKQDYGHVTLAKELIKRNILVVETGCAAIACGKAGLLLPEAAEGAGAGLKAVCNLLGIPPVLHMGSCVDNSRILVMASMVAKELGVGIGDLPLGGAAPEWYSQKALPIGTYFVASGVYTVLGIPPKIFGSKNVLNLLTEGLKGITNSAFAVEPDPVKAADLLEEEINRKRSALGI
ncbi:MAG TPA: anaerobic carbon-monoxide dehydrogenase catalytic subunit [Methanospirillum sp.]|uniref:anaerobic carbon-monoxide dehydrogenase catalytic subunit n=1 Tax=Methanospirillum sp. TaxID=45200 RepID=UPI002BFABED2|nr:anaerobic carbon-monoxide dehydrogenase catalytic subunit [Methanospirillum sp.]HWQ63859.1 anaerobic carbon-monoxide dehydrogenase catalytic subunit [Methanospirillum sp.]